MAKIIPALLLVLLFSGGLAFAEDKMTPERFKKIVAMKGDNVPLAAPFSLMRPYWPKSKCIITIKDANGTIGHDTATVSARTVEGKYIVSTMQTEHHPAPVDYITTYDEKPGTFHVYRMATELITATFVNDPKTKTFSGVALYGDKIKEVNEGTYSDKECNQHGRAYKNGELFLTLDTQITPVTP